uniref:Uncharacterized protein n=1 Tax=Nelumbo nucifera TaxID=4432 RepID=A0A822ZG05_NELNU|nr:TPA_asm: hypothetical protein HUJ06_002292 [Nelumbo nucifera]
MDSHWTGSVWIKPSSIDTPKCNQSGRKGCMSFGLFGIYRLAWIGLQGKDGLLAETVGSKQAQFSL